MWKNGRHLFEKASKIAEAVNIVVLHLQTIVRDTSAYGFVSMDWVELLTELAASLTEWVLGNAVPESVPSTGWTEANLAADDSDFGDVVCDEMIYVVSHLSREAEECGL